MQPARKDERVTRGQLGLATVLFIGVLTIAYGYFHPSRLGLYAGLFVIAGGAIAGIIAIVTRGGEKGTQ